MNLKFSSEARNQKFAARDAQLIMSPRNFQCSASNRGARRWRRRQVAIPAADARVIIVVDAIIDNKMNLLTIGGGS